MGHFTLSATAPEFHPNDEQIERSTLSVEELSQVREDVFDEINLDISTRNYIEETPLMKKDGLRDLHNYIHNSTSKIPMMKKKYYLEAMKLHPNLVLKESDPLAFLRCERYDPEAAAIRLVEYWKQRKSLFGPNAYKEMSLLGEGRGALTEEDLTILHKGHLMVLPKNAAGHAVLFFNGAPNEELPRNNVLRVWFYLLHVVTRSTHVQRDGYIIINSIKGFNLTKHFDRVLGKKAYEIVKSAMPAQIRSSHAMVGKSMPAIQVVAPSSKQMAGKHIRLRSVTHAGSNEEMLLSLKNYGFIPSNISDVIIGGGYTREHFLQWISKQRELELQLQQQQEEESELQTSHSSSTIQVSSSSSSEILLNQKSSECEGTTPATTDSESSSSSLSLSTGDEDDDDDEEEIDHSSTGSNHVKESDDNNNKKLEEDEDDDDDAVLLNNNECTIHEVEEEVEEDDDNNNNEPSTSSSLSGRMTSTSNGRGDLPAFYVLRC